MSVEQTKHGITKLTNMPRIEEREGKTEKKWEKQVYSC